MIKVLHSYANITAENEGLFDEQKNRHAKLGLEDEIMLVKGV